MIRMLEQCHEYRTRRLAGNAKQHSLELLVLRFFIVVYLLGVYFGNRKWELPIARDRLLCELWSERVNSGVTGLTDPPCM